MSVINYYQVAKELQAKAKFGMNNVLDADTFSVNMHVHPGKAQTRLHDCGKDEFFYVLKGAVDMQLEDKLFPLKEGDGILAKAGVKHKYYVKDSGVWMMLVTKQPHKHNYYEKAPKT